LGDCCGFHSLAETGLPAKFLNICVAIVGQGMREKRFSNPLGFFIWIDSYLSSSVVILLSNKAYGGFNQWSRKFALVFNLTVRAGMGFVVLFVCIKIQKNGSLWASSLISYPLSQQLDGSEEGKLTNKAVLRLIRYLITCLLMYRIDVYQMSTAHIV